MNCDQVFDILTRGPFPTGTACDAGVEAHLNVCGQCRRLAEALRPAVELFQEAIGGEESRDLPGYWCAVATDRKQPALSAELHEARSAAAQAPAAARAGAGFSALTVWRMAAMLALGVTLGLLVNSRMSMDGFSTVPPVTASGGAAAADDGESPKARSDRGRALGAGRAAGRLHAQRAGPARRVTPSGAINCWPRPTSRTSTAARNATTPTATACPAAPPRRFRSSARCVIGRPEAEAGGRNVLAIRSPRSTNVRIWASRRARLQSGGRHPCGDCPHSYLPACGHLLAFLFSSEQTINLVGAARRLGAVGRRF